MQLNEIIGYVAAFCTTVAYFPQASKVFKTQKTKDISLGMFLLMTFGIACWLVYGIMLSEMPIISANGISLIFASYILFVKIKNKLKKNE